MKVLFLTDPESDYGSSLLWRGLCNVLGENNVHDYPYKPSWHTPDVWHYTKGSVPHYPEIEGYTSPDKWIKLSPAPPRTTDEVLQNLSSKQYDLLIFGSLRKGVQNTWNYLKNRVALPKTVICDHEDHDVLYASAVDTFRAVLYIKREIFSHTVTVGNIPVLPLPCSCGAVDVMPPGDPWALRDGVFLSCTLTHPSRQIALDALKSQNKGGLGACYEAQYVAGLQQSRIGVSVRGHGVDSIRNWEVPFHGALLLTDTFLAIPQDFTDGVDCIRYTQHASLGTIVEGLLRRDDLVEIAARGQ